MHLETNTTIPGGLLAHRPESQNVGDLERWCSLFTGGSFLAYGLIRGSLLLSAFGGYLAYRGKTGHCFIYDSLGVDSSRGEGMRLTFEQSITVNRPRVEVYRFWRQLENVPSFMKHIESVQSTGDGRSRWVARAPGGIRLQWDAEIVDERENERIAWTSLPGSDVQNRGFIELADAAGDRGTVVRLRIEMSPPEGGAGAAAARLLRSVTAKEIQDDLRRMRQILETGEIATTEHQPAGR